jgi:general stress protein 26
MPRRQASALAVLSGLLLPLVLSPASLARQDARQASGRPQQQTAQPPARPPTRAEVMAAAREMMAAAGYCALITNGEDGYPQAREIDAFPPEDDMTVWMATKAVTRKVAQIRRDPHVTLYYQVSTGAGYVTLFGTAAIVTDPAEKARRWKETWASFYDDRNRGSDYTLIKVTPVRLEIVSLSHEIGNDPKTWRPTSIDFGR